MRDALLDEYAEELRRLARLGLRTRNVATHRRVLQQCPLLSEIPAARRAESTRPTPIFEYVVQAVKDAIDAIELRGQDVDARALRLLMGLSKESAGASWTTRQTLAASEYFVGWEHFRKNILRSCLLEVAGLLLDDAEHESTTSGDEVAAAPVQEPFIEEAEAYINGCHIDEALVLELSTATTGRILAALQRRRVPTRLLVANPRQSRSAWQQERSWLTLVARYNEIFDHFEESEVRVYDVPPSIRGRLLGERLYLGWYTHRDDVRFEAETADSHGIWGHDNAMIRAEAKTQPGEILASWFQREFERLWTHRATVSGQDARDILGLA